MSLQGIYAEPLSVRDTPPEYASIVRITNIFDLNPIEFSVDALLGKYFNPGPGDPVWPRLHVYRRLTHLLDLQ
jgi:hypothetical protein